MELVESRINFVSAGLAILLIELVRLDLLRIVGALGVFLGHKEVACGSRGGAEVGAGVVSGGGKWRRWHVTSEVVVS